MTERMTETRMDWDKAKTLLDGAQRVIILTHIQPDGDAFGSMLGVANALAAQGKTVIPVVDEGITPTFLFLPRAYEVRTTLKDVQADLAIATDCSDERRMGEAGKAVRALGLPLINLDHHRTNTLFGDANLVDAETAAAAEGVLDWLLHMGWPITPETAQCLLTGLVTDTQCFRTAATTAATLGKAQILMAAGADLQRIVQKALDRLTLGILRLWAQVLPTLNFAEGVVLAKVTKAARNEAGGSDRKRDGNLVTVLLRAEEARISCVLREEDNGEVDVSMRAVPGFDVSQVALALGGGGHTLAAGAKLPLSLDEAEVRVMPLLKAAVQAGSPVYGG